MTPQYIPIETNTTNFAVPDFFAEITAVKKYGQGPGIDRLWIFAPTQFFSLIKSAINSNWSDISYENKSSKEGSYILVKTGSNANKKALDIADWLINQQSEALLQREYPDGYSGVYTPPPAIESPSTQPPSTQPPSTQPPSTPSANTKTTTVTGNVAGAASGDSAETDKKTNWLLYGLIAVIAIGIIYYISKK